ncbi:MAG TPA: class I SAM-dependent methyltransferase [Anaerolineales bacterium]|nr:class I SAM-dependent methyltransferase [Anaerolineales bacterium]
MVAALPTAAADRPLRVIEAGAGIGTMIERLLDRGLLDHAVYDAVDLRPEALEAAPLRLRAWAAARGWAVATTADGVRMSRADQQVDVRLHTSAIEAFADAQPPGTADLLLAHAFLDLVDTPRSLPRLMQLLRPGGAFYFTLNFDGVTAFLPQADPAFEERLMSAYHATMDERRPRSSGRFTGRRLFEELPHLGATILDAGASDWWVRPVEGSYPGDEAYFLHFLVETVRRAVGGRTDLATSDVDAWADGRHAQIDAGELIYMAHQWDFAGVWKSRET